MPPQITEMWLPIVLFCLFALFSVLGAYFIAAHFRGRKAGVAAALATLLFFAALAFGVAALLREGGAL